jgi:hypothetical protein
MKSPWIQFSGGGLYLHVPTDTTPVMDLQHLVVAAAIEGIKGGNTSGRHPGELGVAHPIQSNF